MKQREQRILMDLDMLFDIRLAMVEHYIPDLAVVMLHDGRWTSRESDKLVRQALGISYEEYMELYRQCYLRWLKEANLTKLVVELPSLVNISHDYYNPGTPIRHLVINIPFEEAMLSDDEVEQLISILKEEYLGLFSTIGYTRKFIDKSCPVLLYQEGYTDYYCYHWQEWMKAHKYTFGEWVSPGLKIWFPKLKANMEYEVDVQDEVVKALIDDDSSVFDMISAMISTSVWVGWISVESVSTFVPQVE